MTTLPSPQQGQALVASSLLDVLLEDDEITDVVTLKGAHLPKRLRELDLPPGWQQVAPPDDPAVPLARMSVYGPRADGGWQAAETLSVFGYTGYPYFDELVRHADRTLRDLDATDVTTKVLAIPPTRWAAALRSSGDALIGDRRVWMQQSNYVAGSDQPHAGRLIIHTVSVNAQYHAQLAGDITHLSDAVQQWFIASIAAG